eukprot:1151457-Pelagomonas_calceolata.AAC.4
MTCKVTLLFLFGLFRLRFLSLFVLLVCWAVVASRVRKGLVSIRIEKRKERAREQGTILQPKQEGKEEN